MSLFIASTGLVMSPRFLAAHLPVLAAGVFLVVLGKGILVRRRTSAPLPHMLTCTGTPHGSSAFSWKPRFL